MTEFNFNYLRKTSVLAFILIIMNDESPLERHRSNLVLGYQQFFRLPPNDTEVVEDKEVLLKCHVANQAGHVQWSKDGFLLGFDPDVPGWPRYSMSVDKHRGVYNLKIRNVQLIDEGEIECQVGPALDNKPIRASARITVLVPPHEILLIPTNRAHSFNITKQKNSNTNSRLEVREAEKITLACNTSTLSKPPTILKWYRNGIQINKDAYSVIVKENLGASAKLSSTSSALSIYTKLDDNGVSYTCEGDHRALIKPIKSTITLSVLYPPGLPSIEGYTYGDVISAGDTLTLACISRGGNPSAKLVWYKDANEIDSTYSSSGGRESTNIYSFTVTPSDNNAHYKCEATNEVTTHPLIAMIRLNVLFAPVKVDVIGPKQGKIGDVLTLTCVAGPANPSVEVFWLIDGHEITPLSTWTVEVKEGWITSSNMTFTLTSQDPDTKTVSCNAVSKTLGETIVLPINIDILYPPAMPTIIGYKEGTNLRSGELYRFQCVCLGGNPLPTLRWQFIGVGGVGYDREISALTSITGSGVSSELVIRADSTDNSATYRCEASNPATVKPLSASITLSVLYISESVTIKLKPKYPKSGDTLSLYCESGACNPICEVHWYQNGVKLIGQHDGVAETNAPFGGKSTRSKLKLNITSKDDECEIVCEAVNHALARSSKENITLHVLFKPEFMVPPLQKFDVIEGADVSVNLSARGNPSMITYTWWKDSVPLLDISDPITTLLPNVIPHRQHHKRQHQLLSRGPILMIKSVFREDAGEYDCEASNTEGSAKTTILINVLFEPIIVDISKLVLVDSGDSASLYCLAVGNPMTDDLIQWKRKGNTNFLKDSRINAEIEKGRSTLTITNVNLISDSGEYECHVSNGVGENSHETVKLLIKSAPVIISNLTTEKVASDDGETAKMICSARGVPKVHFKWFSPQADYLISTESEIESKNDIKYFRYSVERKQIDDTLYQSVFTIKRVTYSDLNKLFKCVAYNDKGHIDTGIQLQKRSKPDSPNSLQILNITHNSAFLTWIPGFNGGSKQSFKVKFRKTSDDSQTISDSDETDNNFLILNGLESAAEYVFSVIALNRYGESGSDSDSSNSSVIGVTYATEYDSSEALIDSVNSLKSNSPKKSISKIIMIIVFVLGLFLIILNACLLICYFKWKRKITNGNKHTTKKAKAYKDIINGEAILMKALSEENVNLDANVDADDSDVALTTVLMPIDHHSTQSPPNGKHCEVLIMNDLNCSSQSPQQSTTRVLVRKCGADTNTEFKYQRNNSLESQNCPDIIKNRNINSYEIETTNCDTFSSQAINYSNMNGANIPIRYTGCPSIQKNTEKVQLKSILKNGSVRSKQKQEMV